MVMFHRCRSLVVMALVASACRSGGTSPAKTFTAEDKVSNPDLAANPAVPLTGAAAEVRAACHAELDRAKTAIATLTDGQKRDALATLGLWNDFAVAMDNAGAVGGLMTAVHPDQAARDAGDQCLIAVDAVGTQVFLDRKVYDALAAIDSKGLDAGAERVWNLTLRDFRRAGVDKDEATRARLTALNERMTEVGLAFDKNIRDDVRRIEVAPERLAGMPADWLATHPVNDQGKIVVTTDYPDYMPLRTYAQDAPTRRALVMEYLNRGWPKNDEVLKELLALRAEKAKLLGYADWADYDAEVKMIKNADAIAAFIDKIAELSGGAAKRDVGVLDARKKKDDPNAGPVDTSDALYYETLVRKEQFAFDSQEARQYFDFTKTKAGLLAVTGRLFGLEYRPVTDASIWHQDVDVYDVVQDGQVIGRIYLDLHPREGKYKHAAQFTKRNGIWGRQRPEGVLACNFSRGLLEHDEVVTMFHEFGHLMHHVLAGRQKWARFAGVATEWDFVEAPSQMLEEWAWDPDVLAEFATNAAGQPIPADLVKRMRAAEEFGKGYNVRTQMFYAALSLRYHRIDPKSIDASRTAMELQRKYSMFPYIEGTHFQASFGHLNGYSSGYYTYMWSLVIAKDLFSAFQKNGMFDPSTARRYRDAVLTPGGSKDAAELVKDFLGRPYGFDAYKAWLERT
jgi:thimet oligopeptidase